MVPEKPWTRKLGPIGYIVLAIFFVPAIGSVLFFFLLPKFVTAPAINTNVAPNIGTEHIEGDVAAEPIGAFTFLEYAASDNQRSGMVGFKISDVRKDNYSAETIREMFTFFPAQSNYVAQVSPDGTKVAYRTPTELHIKRIDGTNDVLVASLTESGQFAWSDDSKFLVYQYFAPVNESDPLGARGSNISLFNIDDGSTTSTQLELGVIHHVLRVTDDKAFVVRQTYGSADPGTLGYYLVSKQKELETTFYELLTLDTSVLNYTIGADAMTVYYFSKAAIATTTEGAPYEIRQIEVDNGNNTRLLETQSPVYRMITADGHLLYAAKDGLYSLSPTDGTAPKLIAAASLLLDDPNSTDTFEPIALSMSKKYVAMVRIKEVAPGAAPGGQILTVLFVPYNGTEIKTDILTLPGQGLLPIFWQGDAGWKWIGLK